MTSVVRTVSTNLPIHTMQDELGIVYLIDTPQQFWSELEDILGLPEDEAPTLSLLDATLRRYLVLCATYHEQYLQSPLQLEHACNMLLDSELFAFHSERMCEIIVDDAQRTTDPHSIYVFYEVLFFYGRRRSDVFRSHKRWEPLLPLLMDHVLVETDPDIEDTYVGTSIGRSTSFTSVPIPIEAKLRSLSVRLLFEICRVQHLSVQDLKIFDDAFIDYLFDLVEQTRYMQDDTFNYSVIKLIIALNEQFMVAGLGDEESQISPGRKQKEPPEPKNRVIRVMMRRLGTCRTFGENMIFMLNRAKRSSDDFCTKLLILKTLYVIFSTSGTSEYFYTNDLCVLMDVFLRELADLDEDSESLRHTYLRVLHPLLTRTQLRDIPYKRSQILVTLESLLGNSKIREVNPTTKRLVDRCLSSLSGDWCVQLRELRESAKYGTERVGSPNSEPSAILSPPANLGPTAASMQPDVAPGNKIMKSLKHSKSVEQLSARAEPSTRQFLRSPLDQIQTRRPSNGSIHSLPSFVSPTSPKVTTTSANKRRSTNTTNVDEVQTPRHNSLPHAAEHYYQGSSPLASPTRPTPPHTAVAVAVAAPPPPPTTQVEQPSTQTQPHRRPPPPAPTKRRKPPAIPIGRTHGGATITTIRSSESSPLSKAHKSPIGLQQGPVS
ncbi:hypothetical protein BYT27DRAFT_7182270 [Phlegmacium glaucopus]|nr:hypothetical protein BYT27DRAFT_7182270 [Phlegmacium glaucopus]